MDVPLFSSALKDVVVCFTDFSADERQALSEKVSMMSGTVSKSLTDAVNVLISGSVTTDKFRVSVAKGIPVVLKSWIDELWSLSAVSKLINGLNENQLIKFRVPVFYRLKICLSGLSSEEREQARENVVKNGGEYFSDLTVGNCTHLVSKQLSGQKYNYAKKWKIHTVSWDWFIDSVARGYVLDEADYQLSGSAIVSGSTPKSETQKSFDLRTHDMSVISVGSRINETMLFTDDETHLVQENRSIWINCTVTFHPSCQSGIINKWAEIIMTNGGRICPQESSSAVTHVVMGKSATLSHKRDGIVYVNSDWLESCLEERRLVEPDRFAVQLTSATSSWDSIAQFLSDDTVKKMVESTVSNDDKVDEGLFGGKRFALSTRLGDEETAQVVQLVGTHGGSVVDNAGRATHRICAAVEYWSMGEASSGLVSVTVFWVQACVTRNDLLALETDFMYKPVVMATRANEKPELRLLRGCVVSFSGYPGEERSVLKSICTELGAVVQQQMARKAIPSRQVLATTHLIIGKIDNKKYPSSKSWRIPAVTKHWIGACIASQSLVGTDQYEPQLHDNLDCTTIDVSVIGEMSVLSTVSMVPQAKSVVPPKSPEPVVQKINRNQSIETPVPIVKSPVRPVQQKLVLGDLLKTPEFFVPREYRSKKSPTAITTPDIERALKSRLALINNEAKKLKSNKLLLDLTISTDDPKHLPPALGSVAVYISKSAQSQQIALKEIVESLGGKCCWVYDSKVVTHVICGSQIGDLSSRNREELERARRDGKMLVRGDWLTACSVEQRRVNEISFFVTLPEPVPVSPAPIRKRKSSEELSEITNLVEMVPEEKSTFNCPMELQITDKSISRHLSRESIENQYSTHEIDPTRVIMLTNIDKSIRPSLVEAIEKLGGVLEQGDDFSPVVTHLVCSEPSRNEKYLSALAAGKWLLHWSYIEKSMESGRWEDEEEFEWGGPRTSEFMKLNPGKTYNEQERALADTAKSWRLAGGGAFKEWRVCLVEKADKYDKMCKIIECGGGTVLPIDPLPDQDSVTHFLINKNQCAGLTEILDYPCYKIDLIPCILASRTETENKKFVRKCFLSQKDLVAMTKPKDATKRGSTRSSRISNNL